MKKYLIINTSIFAQMNNKENITIETTYDEIIKIADLLTKFENKFYIVDVETEIIIFRNK